MQLDLFQKRLARRTDPVESQLAAVDVYATLSEMEEVALIWVGRYPGSTSTELDNLAKFRSRVIGKRLFALECKGLIRRCQSRRCRITGKTAATWELI